MSNYEYSYIALKKPWLPVILTAVQYDSLPAKEKKKCVNIQERSALVRDTIASPKFRDYVVDMNIAHDYLDYSKKKVDEFTYPIDTPVGVRYIDVGSAFICFTGAKIVEALWKSPKYMPLVETLEGVPTIDTTPQEIYYLHGVFIFDLDTDIEGHSFVLEMGSDYITVYNSYGGIDRVFVTDFDRTAWLDTFAGFFDLDYNEQREVYPWLWGFTRNMTDEILYESPRLRGVKYTRIL